MESVASERYSETAVAEPAWVRALVWIGFPLLGAGTGWLLKAVAGWVVSLPWAPLQGPFTLANQLSHPSASRRPRSGPSPSELSLALCSPSSRQRKASP